MKHLTRFSPVLLVVALVMLQTVASAQCPMCKATVESSLAGGSHVAVGINNGIMYLLGAPFVLFSTLFFLWYYNNKKAIRQQQQVK